MVCMPIYVHAEARGYTITFTIVHSLCLMTSRQGFPINQQLVILASDSLNSDFLCLPGLVLQAFSAMPNFLTWVLGI